MVLASATPSLESVVNAPRVGATAKSCCRSASPRRADADLAAIDLRMTPPERGKWLSPVLVEAVAETLARGEQALLELPR